MLQGSRGSTNPLLGSSVLSVVKSVPRAAIALLLIWMTACESQPGRAPVAEAPPSPTGGMRRRACPFPAFGPTYLPWTGHTDEPIPATAEGRGEEGPFTHLIWDSSDPEFPHASAMLLRWRYRDHRRIDGPTKLRIRGHDGFIASGPSDTGFVNSYWAEGQPPCRSYNLEIELDRAGFSRRETERELRKVLKSLQQ